MAVSVPYAAAFPDGTAYPTIPAGTSVVNVSTSSQLTSALSSATAGQRIVLANGTYSGSFTVSSKNGTSSNGISIEAATVGGAVFASGSTFTISNCAYVTVKGLSFPFDVAGDVFQFRGSTHHSRLTRATFGPTSNTASSDVSTYIYVGDTARHIRIDHNEIRNKGTSGNGVRVYGSFDTYVGCQYVRIDHNIFRSIKPEVGNDKEPIRYGVSSMSRTDGNGVIERNFFTDCLCEPEIISGKRGKLRITGNTIYRCAGGAVIRHGRNSILSDNYIIDGVNTTASAGLESGGIRFYDSGHEISYNYVNATIGDTFQDPLLLDTGDAEGSSTNLAGHWRVINAVVERNVLLATPRGITIGNNYSLVPQNCTIKDNLVVNTPTGTALTQVVAPSGGSITGNLYFASTAAASMTAGADTIYRKAGYGPRLVYLAQADVGPAGDTGDTDVTGALVSGSTTPTPAQVLNIGSGATQNHFQLQYATDGSTGTNTTTAEQSQVESGWSDPLYFTTVTTGGTTQILGVGGIPTASGTGVTLITADSTSTLNITASNVTYDGQGHTVPKINITGSNVTVQNFYVRGGANSGIYSLGSNNTIQNNDIAQIVVGDGDINGITFFGDGTRVLFNKIDNLVSGDPGGSHTDGIQSWATPSKNSSSNVTIKGNWINGPVQSDVRYIHQGVMAEGPESTDGGGGGSGVSRNWIVDGNYFKTYGNQCLKFDDIHDVTITRNTFAGSATKLVETGSLSTGINYYSDNTVTGSFGSNGVSIISGSGPGGGGDPSGTHAVQFRVRADSAHTSGSSFPRSELRETLADGSEQAFQAMVGEHTLHTRARITHLPAADPEVIVAQLHDGTTERISVRTQLVSGQIKLLCRINGTQVDPRFSENYVIGTEFEVLIRVLDGGVVNVHYNGASTPTVTGQLVSTGGPTWYFKTGAYAQFDGTTAGSTTEYVTVEHRDIQVSHTGSGVSAGADTSVQLGQALNRTAVESALSGVTSRKWEIMSGPGTGPTVDTTTAAGRLGWGDPIPAWSDEFNYVGAPNSSKWGVYNGVGHDGNGRRRPERANVDGTKLVMDGLANGDSAGMESKYDQQYGRYECRARSFNTGSSGAEYSPVLLLWPLSDSRKQDGEYDFSEPGSPGSSELTAFMHFPGDGDQQREFNKTGVNLGDWHNFAFEWTPTYLKGYLDGVEWFNTSGGSGSGRRNIQDMPAGHLCIQLDNFNGSSGNRPARFEVDWARIYTLTPTGGGGGTGPAGTQLSTTAVVNWTPTTLGTYVLRYTAVTATGTFTDDVTVQVIPPSTGGGPQTVVPNAISSEESWGLPTVEVEPPAGAVPSLLGDMILGQTAYLGYSPGPTSLMIVPSSIPSAEHFGIPTVVVKPRPVPQDIFPDSIPSRERWGAPVVTLGAAPPDLPVTDITVSLFAIDPSEGRGLPLPDFTQLTLSPERNSPGSISVDYPAEGINFGFLRDAITDGRDVQVEIWVSGTSNRALRGYLQEAQGDDTDEDGEVWTFAGQFLEIRMSDAVIEPQDPGPSPAMAADVIAQRMISGGHIDDDLTWDGAPAIVELYAPLILEQWIKDRKEDDTAPIPNLAWLVAYVGDTSNQEHANEKREMIFASATPGQVMIYAMDQARRRGTLTDVAVDFTLDFDSDGVEWPQVISTRFSPGAAYDRILDQLVTLGLVEWAVEWTGTAQVLRMWVPEGRGEDLTLNDPPLVLRHGQNLLDAPHKWSLRDTGTYVLVAGADGLYDTASDPTAQAVRGRRIEKFTSANNLNTPTAVESYAQQQLTVVTTPLLEVTHGIGMQPGSPRPIASFDVGDWLYSDTDGALTRYRVVQWTLTVSNDQSLSGTVTLNDTTADALLSLKARMDALTAGETVVGTSEGSFQSDAGVPLAPTGVVASSVAFLVPSEPSATNPDLPPAGEIHAAVTVGWLPVVHNTNGSAASDLGGYKVQYAYDQQPDLWIGLEDVGPNRQSTTFDASPGVNLAVRVSAYDRNGNVSDWSEIVHHTVAVDDQPPSAPSAPTVTDYLGTIRVLWDGNTVDGIDIVLAAPDFDHIEVHMDAGSNFTPSGSTKVGQMRGPGGFSITDLPYGVEQFVRLVAVDKGGNLSSPSAQASATPGKLVNIDIGPDAISRVQIIDGEIVNAKIADLAVNDAKVSNLSVGKLTAGFLSADVIMSSGEIRTGIGNTYGTFSSGGLQFYRAGLLTVDLNAASGDALVTGTYRSGLVGERINILPDGTLRIYGASGTDYGEIRNEGGIWRATSRADDLGRRSYLDMNPGGLTAWYGTIGERRSKIDVNYDYAVLTAAVTGVRIWDQFNPSDNTENRFHLLFANSGGDIEDSVVHFVRNPFKSTNPAFNAPGIQGGEASGITFRNNAVAATRGDGNAYVYVDGAEFHALSSELNKREIAPIRFAGGRSARDVIDSVASYGWTYDFPASPRSVTVQRRQPDGSMATETVDVDTTPTEPPRRHYFPIAEHLAAVAPELVRTTPEGEYMVGIRDSLGVVWETVREISAELRHLRRFVGLDESRPVVIEGNVIDPTRWKQLPE